MPIINIDEGLINMFLSDNEFNTFDNLLKYYNCSIRTLRRKIKQIGLLASYNHNSKYYTLPSIPVFDDHGIWYKQGICFSVHGSLVKTVTKLVHDSKAGYTSGELSSILHVKVNDLLLVQTNKQALKREKYGRAYVYYSTDKQDYARQYKERQSAFNSLVLQDITLAINNRDAIIAILVELILNGNLSAQVLRQRLSTKSLDISMAQIEVVLLRLGLKKTIPKS